MALSRYQLLKKINAILRSEYPPEQGWEFLEKENCEKYKVHFILQRKQGKQAQRVIAKISQSSHIGKNQIATYNSMTRRMSGRYVKVVERLLWVEKDTGVEEVTPNITLRYF